jgi:Holliday junction resolvase
MMKPVGRKSSYAKGIRAERIVKKSLEKKGWLVKQSKGSKGPYDLYALKGGRKLLIQVKSGTSSLRRREKHRLRKVAKKKGAKALYMKVDNRGKISSKFV